jgi:hypothetical protein
MKFRILYSREEVADLSPLAERLMLSSIARPNITYTPSYFLFRLESSQLPCVVTCWEGGHLTGILYASEFSWLGVRTGWAFGGDYCGRGLLLAGPEREVEILAAASGHLLEHAVHAARFYWSPHRAETAPVLSHTGPSLRFRDSLQQREEGDWLQLPSSYEEFLNRLGSHTRRNLRYFRRKSEQGGYAFAPALSPAEYERAVHGLNAAADYAAEPARADRDRSFFAHFGSPVFAGIRAPNGDLVSVLSGVAVGTHFHVLTQLNHLALRKLSISLVLRGYVIENLIRAGFTTIHFVEGASRMLGQFCDPVVLHTLTFDRTPSLVVPMKQLGSGIARLLRSYGRRVPIRLQFMANTYWSE